MFKIKKKKLFIPIIILVLTAFLALIGYISIIFLGHYVIDEKKLAFSAFAGRRSGSRRNCQL